MNTQELFLNPIIITSLISFLITPVVIKLSWKINLIDDPKTHIHPKVIHTIPTPRGGGLAIFLTILTSAALFLPIDKHLIGILIGALLITLLGLADDKWNLNPYLRIVLQFAAAAAPIAAGIGISFVNNPLVAGQIINLSYPRIIFSFLGETKSIWIFSDLFALFWIIFMMNMLNMGAKGVDGQLSGTVAIAAVTIAVLSLKYRTDITQWPVITLAAITAGAYLGFLAWHRYPQKIMPGFGGANLAGFLLAVLAILSTTKVGVLTVALAVPMIDTGYIIIKRVLSGKSPVWGDRGHLHHKLLDLGWSKPKVAWFYWLLTALLGILALNLNSSLKFYTMIGALGGVLGLILWLTYRPKSQN